MNHSYGVELKESNYNVSIFFTKVNATVNIPDARAIARLLHPTDSSKDKKFPNELWPAEALRWGWTNAMTSAELEEYCVDGHIVLSVQ